MNKTFSIVIDAVTKGFDTAKSAITSAIGGGSDEAKAKLALLKAEISELEKQYTALDVQLRKVEGFKKLQAEAAALEAEWKTTATKAAQLAQEIRTTDGDTKKLSDAFRVTQKEALALENQFTKKTVALHKLDESLLKSGFDTKNLAVAEQTLVAKMGDTSTAIDKNKSAYASLSTQSEGFFSKLKESSSSSLSSLRASLSSTAAQLVGMYLSFQGFSKVTAIVQESESAMFNLESSVAAANREFQNTGSVDDWKGAIGRLSGAMKIYSDSDIANAISRTVDMTKRLGLEKEQMEEVIKRSADLGAGKVELTGAIERVTAALRGEAESSEFLGLTLNENYVKAWHEAHNVHQVAWKDLTDIEKAQVRYNVFLEQSAEMQGRAANSAKTFSGMLKSMGAEFDNIIAKSPTVQAAMAGITTSAETNRPALKNLVEGFATLGGWIINIGVYILDLVNRGFGLLAGGIEKIVSVATLGALNIKKAWAEIFGTDDEVKAIQRQIDAEKAFLKVVNDTIEGFKTRKKEGTAEAAEAVKGTETKAAAEKKAAEQIKKANEEKAEAIKKQRIADLDLALKNMDRESAALSTALKQQIANIQLAMAEKRITTEEGEAKIAAIETKAAVDRIATLKKALAEEGKITGDAYAAREKIRDDLTQKLADAELDLTNIKIREANTRTKAEEESAAKALAAVKDAQKEEVQAVKDSNAEKAKSNAEVYRKKIDQLQQASLVAGQELGIQLDQIDILYQADLIGHDEMIAQKLAAERKFKEEKIALAQQAMAAAAEAYGEESAEYAEAKNKMKAAAEDLAEVDVASQKTRANATQDMIAGVIQWKNETVAAAKEGSQSYAELKNTIVDVYKVFQANERLASGDWFGSRKFIQNMNTEVMQAIGSVMKEMEALATVARDAFGVVYDLDDMTLNGIRSEVQGLIATYRDLESELKGIKAAAGDIKIDFADWKAGFSDAETAAADLERRITTLDEATRNLKTNTGDVSSAYSDVVSSGEASIAALKAQWDDLGKKIADIETQIQGVYTATGDSVLELQRALMDDEQLWLSKRQEMYAAFDAAVQASNAGNMDEATALFDKARDLAKATAADVKDANGEILYSQEITTAQSIAMIEKIETAQVSGLERFKTTIETEQTGIMGLINSVMVKLEQVLDAVLKGIGQKVEAVVADIADIYSPFAKYLDIPATTIPGVPKLAEGGILRGKTHAQGGIILEAEDKELIVSADSTEKIARDYGWGAVDDILHGRLPKAAAGGFVQGKNFRASDNIKWEKYDDEIKKDIIRWLKSLMSTYKYTHTTRSMDDAGKWTDRFTGDSAMVELLDKILHTLKTQPLIMPDGSSSVYSALSDLVEFGQSYPADPLKNEVIKFLTTRKKYENLDFEKFLKGYRSSKQLPEFPIMETGGILRGNTHAQGGILVEAENNELFVSADSTEKIAREHGWGAISEILKGKLPHFGNGGLISEGLMNSLPMPQYADGGLVSDTFSGSAGPEKTVRVKLDFGGRQQYSGIFPEADADGLVRALLNAKSRAV